VTVNIPAGTGDWFGGWDGDSEPEGHRYSNQDATSGRMVELIQRGEPALMLCHWPGMYTHGTRKGFEHFKQAVTALEGRFGDQTIWMKLNEIARYWAAKGLTQIQREDNRVILSAPFACPLFTLRIPVEGGVAPSVSSGQKPIPIREVARRRDLASGTWLSDRDRVIVCFDLPKGEVVVTV
jgi:hypothetical protein